MSNKALIIANFQREFIDHNQDLTEKIITLAKDWPEDHIYWKVFQNTPDSLFERHLGWGECIHTPESSIIHTNNISRKNIIETQSYSFPYTLIQNWQNKYKDVFICGAETDAGVLATAFSLWDFRIRPIILADYCTSKRGEDYHLPALKIMKRQFGKKSVLYGDYKATDFIGR